ncbi:hypothetical protein Acr_09g0002680 [Actinidia rufa]|uniref:Encoded peptide n=1 Tax=Actinidia rufa TaxID=165716 RepID=A0A7J0F547_9ERIC|nr:hypothetical protein Acr_09g0002680 [Actinidia rufa]
MAQIKFLVASILLVLPFFMCIQSSDGRKLNLLRENDFPKFTSHSLILTKETKKNVDQNSNVDGESTNRTVHTNESVPTAPMSPTAPSQSVNEPPPLPPAHVDNFRPTAPGHSPGVGHFLQT